MRSRPAQWARLLLVVVLGASVLVPVVGSVSPSVVGAQPQVVQMVSNLVESTSAAAATASTVVAQQFTTGTSEDGYTLSGIAVRATTAATEEQAATVRAQLWSWGQSAPEEKLADLTVPTSFAAHTVVEFTAPAYTTLSKETSYALVVYTVGSYNFSFQATTSDNEGDGVETKQAGWSIGNNRHEVAADEPGASPTWAPHSTDSAKIRVRGSFGSQHPADLTALAVEFSADGSTFFSGALYPAFRSIHPGVYQASVDHRVSHVRVTPTARDSAADIAVDTLVGPRHTVSSGTASPAIALKVGDNTFLVDVTVADGSNKTYSVRVRRAAPVLFVPSYLDLGFSSADSLSTGFADGQGDWGSAVAVGGDGAVVVAGWTGGTSSTQGNSDFAVARYRDGVLDPTFGTDGKVTTPVSASFGDRAYAVAVQPDGKVVAAGEAWVDEGGDSEHDFALVRYNVDGSLDTSFGGDGIVTTAVSGSWGDRAYAVSVLPDNKVVAAGHVYVDGDRKHDFALVRYNDDGSLDTSFGDGGIVTTRFGDSNEAAQHARAMAVAPDGTIVVAGYVESSSSGDDFMVARYNRNGSMDATFSGAAGRSFSIGAGTADDRVEAVAVAPDGKITLAGRAGNDFAVARLTEHGNFDTGFDTDGKVTTDFGSGADHAYAMAIAADGTITVAGSSHNGTDTDFAAARYTPDGSLDTTFSSDGKATINISGGDIARAAALDSTGNVLLAGHRGGDGTGADFALAALDADGNRLSAFDTPGWTATGLAGGSNDRARAVAIGPSGKIMVAGIKGASAPDLVLARYAVDGSLDASFGSGGTVTGEFDASTHSWVTDVAVNAVDGKIVVVGRNEERSFMANRYLPDGALDTGFDSDGRVTYTFGGPDDAEAVAVQPDGKIVLAGGSDSVGVGGHFAAVRLNADGSVDTSFGTNGEVISTVGGSIAKANAMAIQTDGRIVLAGATSDSPGEFALLRLNADGSHDASFGGGAGVTTAIAGTTGTWGDAVAVQRDGKIVAAGKTDTDTDTVFALARYNPDGSLDASFGTGGTVTGPVGRAASVVVQRDGKILVVGRHEDIFADRQFRDSMVVARFNADGTPDAGFGNGGSLTYQSRHGNQPTFDAALQGDRIIVAGAASNGADNDFAVLGFDPGEVIGTDATLSRLSASPGTNSTTFSQPLSLMPEFDPATTSYFAAANADSTHVWMQFSPTDSKATVYLSDAAVVPLAVGENIINLRVVAEDGATIRDYTVTVWRPHADSVWSSTLTPVLTGHFAEQVGCGDNAQCRAQLSTPRFSHQSVLSEFNSVVDDDPAGPQAKHRFRVFVSNASIPALQAMKFCVGTTGYDIASGTVWVDEDVDVGFEVGVPVFLSIGPSCGDTSLVNPELTLATNVDETGLPTVYAGLSSDKTRLQSFRTGDWAKGYELSSVTVLLAGNVAEAKHDSITAQLWSSSGHQPSTKLFDLVVPDHPVNAGWVTFTAPDDAVLAANTTYWLVFHADLGSNGLRLTRSGAEAGASGWTFENHYYTSTAAPGSAPPWSSWAIINNHVWRTTLKGREVGTGSDNAGLATLAAKSSADDGTTFTDLTLSSDTAAGTWSARVPNETTQVKLIPTVADTGLATVAVGYQRNTLIPVTSGSESQAFALAVGPNAFTVRVTAEDGRTTKDYTLTVTRDVPVSADLSALAVRRSVDGTTFSPPTGVEEVVPVFAAATTGYRATVGSDITHVQVTPTVSHSASAVKVGKAGGTLSPVTSGQPSAAIALDVGDNAITVEVTASDSTTKNYTVTVRRVPTGTGWYATLEPAAIDARSNLGIGCHFDTGEEVDSCSRLLTDNAVAIGTGAANTFTQITDWDSNFLQVKLDEDPNSETQALSFCIGDNAYAIASSSIIVAESIDAGWAAGVPVSLSIGTDCTATLPSIALSSDAAGDEKGEGEVVTVTVTLSRAAPSGGVTVTLARAGTATDTDDYSLAGTLTLVSGETEVGGFLSIVDDALVEADETVVLSATAVGHTPGSLTVTIIDNDTAAKPTGLTAAAGDARLDVSWMAPAGVLTGYDVHYTSALKTGSGAVGDDAAVRTDNDDTAGWVDAGHTGTTASHPITGRDNGTKYRVRVRATSAAGAGEFEFTTGTPETAVPTLVANIGQDAANSGPSLVTISIAQGFTAGSGAVLAGIEAASLDDATSTERDTVRAELWSAASGGGPGSNVADLAVPTVFPGGRTLFAAPAGTALTAGADYYFVLYTTGSFALLETGSMTPRTDEDAGGLSGWSVEDGYWHSDTRAAGSWTKEVVAAGTLRIAVRGTGATASANADLDTLTAEGGSSAGGPFTGFPLSFDSATDSYSATVPNATTHVKLTPTVDDTGKATVAVGPQGQTLADVADGTASDALALSVGANAFTVRVTAEDTSTTKDYTVTVTRATAGTPTIALTAGASSVAEGGTVTVTATLSAAAPTGGVTVALGRRASGSTAAEGDFSVSAITVSAGATSGTAMLTATDDRVDEEDETLVLRGTATGHTAGSLSLTIADNDTAGATVSATSRSVAVSGTAAYTVRLNSQPTANVVITATSSDTTKATVSPATLTFTDSNWATAQEVTITGVAAGTGLTVTHAVTTANTAGKYLTTLAIDSVAVTVTAQPPPPPGVPTVSLSASPNPVRPGTAGQVWHERRATVTVKATLSRPLDRVVVIPVTTTRTTSEQGDHGLIDKIVIGAGQLEGSRQIGIFGDRDSQDDTFTVALDTARLPRPIAAGATPSVAITIDDADSDAAPSAAVTGLTATPKVRYLVLTWNKPSERATHYEIQYKTAAAPDQDATDQDPTTGWVWRLNRRYGTEDTTTRHITRLTAGTTYDVRVRAVNDTAPGPWATTQATPCQSLTRGQCP